MSKTRAFLGCFLSVFDDYLPATLEHYMRDCVMIVQDLFRARLHVVKCPLSDSNVISAKFDHNGGTVISKHGDIKVDVPKGAIKDGFTLQHIYKVYLCYPRILIWLVHNIGLEFKNRTTLKILFKLTLNILQWSMKVICHIINC